MTEREAPDRPCPNCGRDMLYFEEPYPLGGITDVYRCNCCDISLRILPPPSEVSDFNALDAPGRRTGPYIAPIYDYSGDVE